MAVVVAEGDQRARERSAIADAQAVLSPSVRAPCAVLPPRMEQLVVLGIENDSNFAPAVRDKGDRHAVVMRAAQEIVRAVYGIDDPDSLLAARERRCGFLAEKRVIRKFPDQFRTNQGFHRAVGLAHIVLRPFALDGERAAPGEVIVRKLTGLARNFAGGYVTCVDGQWIPSLSIDAD